MPAKRMNKSLLLATLSEKTDLSKKQVTSVMVALNEVIVGELQKKKGEITLPGLLKLAVVIKPATPEREGLHPITKQPTIFKAKPERKVVKARALKALKDAIA